MQANIFQSSETLNGVACELLINLRRLISLATGWEYDFMPASMDPNRDVDKIFRAQDKLRESYGNDEIYGFYSAIFKIIS